MDKTKKLVYGLRRRYFLTLGIRARLRKKKPSLVCFSLHLLGSSCSSKKKREEIKVWNLYVWNLCVWNFGMEFLYGKYGFVD